MATANTQLKGTTVVTSDGEPLLVKDGKMTVEGIITPAAAFTCAVEHKGVTPALAQAFSRRAELQAVVYVINKKQKELMEKKMQACAAFDKADKAAAAEATNWDRDQKAAIATEGDPHLRAEKLKEFERDLKEHMKIRVKATEHCDSSGKEVKL